jgi:hypothetical protein
MSEIDKTEENAGASTEPDHSKGNVKVPEPSETRKNLELIHSWYQSYYMWSITCSHLALNSQLNSALLTRKFLKQKIKKNSI